MTRDAEVGTGAQRDRGFISSPVPDLIRTPQVLRMDQPDPTTLAMGTDLTTLGLNLNSPVRVKTLRALAQPKLTGLFP